MDEQIKKMWYRYTMEYYLAIRKNQIMSYTGKWMDLAGGWWLMPIILATQEAEIRKVSVPFETGTK
jgi:hypothetical protein